MKGILDPAANRIAPWRGADWRVLIGEGVVPPPRTTPGTESSDIDCSRMDRYSHPGIRSFTSGSRSIAVRGRLNSGPVDPF